ncbi:hypothetical protein EVAR_77197_1 [Eumeta japonica]|uniref:Uncharacterized protein n=1 Tax=Eumeta variegata TaxID=151549 RepID=A0A4C1T4Y8_EUMVA|nr:hypothetical protein EVAR_77197_1 [Eumeta japonica]
MSAAGRSTFPRRHAYDRPGVRLHVDAVIEPSPAGVAGAAPSRPRRARAASLRLTDSHKTSYGHDSNFDSVLGYDLDLSLESDPCPTYDSDPGCALDFDPGPNLNSEQSLALDPDPRSRFQP